MWTTQGFHEACQLTECQVPQEVLPRVLTAGPLASEGTCSLRLIKQMSAIVGAVRSTLLRVQASWVSGPMACLSDDTFPHLRGPLPSHSGVTVCV